MEDDDHGIVTIVDASKNKKSIFLQHFLPPQKVHRSNIIILSYKFYSFKGTAARDFEGDFLYLSIGLT